MEMTCNRCHQNVDAESCYCPTCGLPQLVYASDAPAGQTQAERLEEGPRDASSVAWKPALQTALKLAIPTGILCSMLSPVGIFGWFLMAVAAAGAVALYIRSQSPAWITLGAGARIGLVTGLLGSWSAAATSGITLFVMRFVLHQGNLFDDFWQNFVNQRLAQQYTAMGIDANTIGLYQKWLLSPEGRAGFMFSAIVFLAGGLLLFSVAGGAMGARLLARSRRPEI